MKFSSHSSSYVEKKNKKNLHASILIIKFGPPHSKFRLQKFLRMNTHQRWNNSLGMNDQRVDDNRVWSFVNSNVVESYANFLFEMQSRLEVLLNLIKEQIDRSL